MTKIRQPVLAWMVMENLSAGAVAREIGLTENYVRSQLSGNRKPTKRLIDWACARYRMPPSVLFRIEANGRPPAKEVNGGSAAPELEMSR